MGSIGFWHSKSSRPCRPRPEEAPEHGTDCGTSELELKNVRGSKSWLEQGLVLYCKSKWNTQWKKSKFLFKSSRLDLYITPSSAKKTVTTMIWPPSEWKKQQRLAQSANSYPSPHGRANAHHDKLRKDLGWFETLRYLDFNEEVDVCSHKQPLFRGIYVDLLANKLTLRAGTQNIRRSFGYNRLPSHQRWRYLQRAGHVHRLTPTQK